MPKEKLIFRLILPLLAAAVLSPLSSLLEIFRLGLLLSDSGVASSVVTGLAGGNSLFFVLQQTIQTRCLASFKNVQCSQAHSSPNSCDLLVEFGICCSIFVATEFVGFCLFFFSINKTFPLHSEFFDEFFDELDFFISFSGIFWVSFETDPARLVAVPSSEESLIFELLRFLAVPLLLAGLCSSSVSEL